VGSLTVLLTGLFLDDNNEGSRIIIYRFLSIVFSCIGFIFSYLFIISIALGHLRLTPVYERILVYSLIIWEYITGIYYIRKGKNDII